MPEWNCQTTGMNKALHTQTKSWYFVTMLLHSHGIKLEKVINVYIKVTTICPSQIPTAPPATSVKSFVLFMKSLWAAELAQWL